MFFSEFVFWTRLKPEDSIEGIIYTGIFYALATFAFLVIIKKFNVKSIWALFLAGAFYGWIIEGIFVQTMYLGFPINISWTGLAWHALISVWIGFYYLRKTLSENNYLKTILVSSLIGLIWGIWSIFWWVEGSAPAAPLLEYSLYSLSSS